MSLKALRTKVKSSKFLYKLYFALGSLGIGFLKIFTRPKKLILFNSFGGKKYDDSPKEIYLKMIEDHFFDDYDIVWAFHSPDDFEIPKGRKIKADTFKYFVTALQARVWVTNSGIERGLSFKGKKTIYLNTWHGTPIKKMGNDIAASNQSFKSYSKNHTDLMNAQSDFEADVFSRVFGIEIGKFIKVGLPRNDRLVDVSIEEKKAVREKLGIKDECKVILYAPTFREYCKNEKGEVSCDFPFDMQQWKNMGKNSLILFRAHYEVSRFLNLPSNDSHIRDVSSYPNLNDLIIASDILISDYSSIIFDYALTDKPIVLFTYDYDQYAKERGVYFDIREWFQSAETESELIDIIKNINVEQEKRRVKSFKENYLQYYGNAAGKSVDILKEKLG